MLVDRLSFSFFYIMFKSFRPGPAPGGAEGLLACVLCQKSLKGSPLPSVAR